jgi:hypothetical protein
MQFDRFQHVNDAQDQPLDLVSFCSAQRCNVSIHHGDKAVQGEYGDWYCCPECYIRATGGNIFYAGTEELA